MISNNPPDVVLELTQKQAEFLLNNCDANIRLGLMMLQQGGTREQVEKLVEMNESFKEIKKKLMNLGVKVPF